MEALLAFPNLHLMCSSRSAVESPHVAKAKGSQHILCSFIAKTGADVAVKTYRHNVFKSSEWKGCKAVHIQGNSAKCSQRGEKKKKQEVQNIKKTEVMVKKKGGVGNIK